jgi:ectoine hydroxylase-related dioxygenase (phytanoyl-CoA dioxygenase family)
MPQDLSRKHHLVGTLFTWPRSEAEWQAFELSADQVSFYQQNGYLAGIKLLNDEQVAALCTEVDELTNTHHPGRELFYEYHSNESTDPNTVLFHALGAWRVTPGLHDVLCNPAFVMAAAQLLQAPVRFWHDQIFYKPARHGGVVAWHQDFSYWTRTRPMAHLSCWIGLDDSTIENGCVQYVPRSHQWELLPITGLANDMNSIQSVLSGKQQNEFQPVPIELKKGEASFHHPLMVHGSFENKTEKPRRAIVINAFADGVLSDSNEPLLAGVPPIPRGERMQGQFFPLLFDPAS